MADYGCYLWSSSPELQVHRDAELDLDPEKLGISAHLIQRLTVWHRDWQEMACSTVGFASPDARREWVVRGWDLAVELQEELDPVVITYFHRLDGGEDDREWTRPVPERTGP